MIGSMILLIVLILLNAVFASAEIAVISMNEAKLQALTQAGNKKALKLTKLTQHSGSHYPGWIFKQCLCCRLFFRPSGFCIVKGRCSNT